MKRAFSLIEISITLLIIGIIIAGITQSSSLARKTHLNTARTLTKSSPVSGIKDLVFWIESASEESFATNISDGSLIAQWNDINPQQSNKNNITQSVDAAKPTYKTNGLNGLPAASFDGGDVLNGARIEVANKTLTLFIVYKSTSLDSQWRALFTNRNGTSNGFGFWQSGANARDFTFDDFQDYGSAAMSLFPEFVSITYDGNTNINMYSNGSATDEITSNSAVMTATNSGTTVAVGAKLSTGFQPFIGMISEIILFDRVLTTEERQAVEKYLGQKWGIKLKP